ncbi:MAG TPA: hypothetical protein VFR41_15545 [Acidimicrobiia bacterium]|nr:hypothetical protein [Acidimicrobiia bacterium]
MTFSEFRRQFRRAAKWRNWPRRRKIASAVWVPALIAVFVTSTGPFAQATSARRPVEPAPAPVPQLWSVPPPSVHVSKWFPQGDSPSLAQEMKILRDNRQRTDVGQLRRTLPLLVAERRHVMVLARTRPAVLQRQLARDKATLLLQQLRKSIAYIGRH